MKLPGHSHLPCEQQSRLRGGNFQPACEQPKLGSKNRCQTNPASSRLPAFFLPSSLFHSLNLTVTLSTSNQHQHKALPDHLFFQPACEGSVDPDTVDTRQRLIGRCWFHGVYAAVEWEGWDDDQDFLNCWRSFDYSETYWVESGDQYSDSEDDDAEEPDSEEEAEEADHGAEQDTSSEEATDGYEKRQLQVDKAGP